MLNLASIPVSLRLCGLKNAAKDLYRRLKAPFNDRRVLNSNCLALNQAGLNLDCDPLNKEESTVTKDSGLTGKPSKA
jgi:hypothetical protein